MPYVYVKAINADTQGLKALLKQSKVKQGTATHYWLSLNLQDGDDILPAIANGDGDADLAIGNPSNVSHRRLREQIHRISKSM